MHIPWGKTGIWMLLLPGCSSPVCAIPSPSWISTWKASCSGGPQGPARLQQVATDSPSEPRGGASPADALPADVCLQSCAGIRCCCLESPVQFSRSLRLTLCDPWTAVRQAALSITYSQSLLKLMSIESVMPPRHLILCHPLLLLPALFPASGSFPMSQF